MSDSFKSFDSGSSGADGWPDASSSTSSSSPDSGASGADDGWGAPISLGSDPGGSSPAGDDAGWPSPAPMPGGSDGWPAPAADEQGQDGIAAPEEGGSSSGGDRPEAGDSAQPKTNRLVWVVAAVIVIALPIGVGIMAFRQPAGTSAAGTPEPALMAEEPGEPFVEADAPDPIWTRPSWADSVDGMVAFELPAGDDVRLANGRIRPTLGISCANGRTDVHVATGGSAPIDPVTSGHVVGLVFDGASAHALEQQWVASDDQRNLLAPEPLDLALRIASARRLELAFTHYMTGSEVLVFDLRGADRVVASMAGPCGWSTD